MRRKDYGASATPAVKPAKGLRTSSRLTLRSVLSRCSQDSTDWRSSTRMPPVATSSIRGLICQVKEEESATMNWPDPSFYAYSGCGPLAQAAVEVWYSSSVTTVSSSPFASVFTSR